MDTFAEGEHQIDKSSVRTSLLFFWHKTNLTLTNKRLMGTVPNTVLLVFPIGRREVTQPLNRISNVGYSAKFHLFRFLIGLILLVFGISLLGDGDSAVVGLFVLIVSILVLGWSWGARIMVTDNSGKENKIPVSMLDKKEVDRFLGVINRTLAETHDQPSSPAPDDSTSTQPPDRIEQLQRITALRDAETLSEEEFQAEKARIMDA